MRIRRKRSSFSKGGSFQNRLLQMMNNDKGGYLKIWEQFPSYKDVNLRLFIFRSLFLVAVANFFIVSLFIITSHILLSIIIGALFIGFFLYVFSDNFRMGNTLKNFKQRKRIYQAYPFRDVLFWREDEVDSTIYFSHRKDALTTGLKIFRIEVIPENIHPALNNFLHNLNNVKLPFTYQVVQKPRGYNSSQSYTIQIYLCIYLQEKGFLTTKKLETLRDSMEKRAEEMRSAFFANLHHFKTKLLAGISLIRALRTVIFKLPSHTVSQQEVPSSEEFFSVSPRSMLKLGVTIFLTIAIDIILGIVGVPVLFMIPLNLLLIIGVLFLFWREVLFFRTVNILHSPTYSLLNPFHDLTFFRSKEEVFIHDDTGIVGLRIFNLQHIKPEIYSRKGKFINKTERLFRVLLSQKSPFTYTIHSNPLSYSKFYKKAKKLLKEHERLRLEKLEDMGKKESWMDFRTGIWETMMTITASSYLQTERIDQEVLYELGQALERQAMVLENAFSMNFSGFYLRELRSQNMLEALKTIFLKTRGVSINGTTLNYLLLQGKTLRYLVEISDEFKRGLDTKIAAEFTTPLHLKNSIVFGKTINTEYLDEEVPAGLLLDQTQRLILNNGLPQHRDLLAMKIVIELMHKERSAIIFDFNGDFSRLIRYFSGTPLEEEFFYFQLGKTFRVNPIYSDIPYDQNNLEYLDYVFDSYALAFRQSKKMVENLKSLIKSNEELDLPSLALKLENQREWEKNSLTESAISLFRDFSDQFLIFSGQGETQETRITCTDFLTNNKTVILDVSLLKDLEQKLFIAFILLSKMIHYITYSESYIPKTIYIPNTDIFFDRWYLDKVSNYGKIASFMEPLFKHNFGVMMSMSQVNNVHPKVFSYFPNILSFRTIDSREIKVLKSYMNLQELQDTGFYSSKRKDAYQVHYLMTLPKDEILMKRSDFDQSFPVKVRYNSLAETSKLSYDEIRDYMKQLGYDIELSEEEILNCTKRNLFEKDLGDYSIFTEEVITFLKAMKVQHNVGNLYKTKLKEELKKIIYPKAALLFQKSRRKIMAARDRILELLIQHGYIMEAHPQKASGNQTIRTSYMVSPKFEVACEDYEKSSSLEGEISDEFSFDPEDYEDYEEYEGNSTEEYDPQEYENGDNHRNQGNTQHFQATPEIADPGNHGMESTHIHEEAFKRRLTKAIGSVLIYNMAKLDKYLREGDYVQSEKLEKRILPKFILTLRFEDGEKKDITDFSQKDLYELLVPIVEHESFPFDLEDMQFFLRRMQFSGITDEEERRERIDDNYQILSEIVKKIQLILFGGNNHES